MRNVTFALKKVSNALTDKKLYRASVQANSIIGHEELAKLLAERTKLDATSWRYFLDVIANEIDTQLLEGNGIKLGRLLTGFAIRGTFTSEDERFNPERHQLLVTLRTLAPLRDSLSSATPENVIASNLTCIVAAAMDSVTKRLSEITGTNCLLLQGRRLGISPDNPDEGVWLENPKTGKIAAMAWVERSDDQTIDCVFTEPPEPGTYTLVVACRNGERETLAPAIARVKDFTVRAPSRRIPFPRLKDR